MIRVQALTKKYARTIAVDQISFVAKGQIVGFLGPNGAGKTTTMRKQTDFAVVAREELGKWWQPELVEHLMDGLHNAGLEIASE
jgi:ABC-type uncharacterized transport system ATPase subunit